jgi:hypothetical protein
VYWHTTLFSLFMCFFDTAFSASSIYSLSMGYVIDVEFSISEMSARSTISSMNFLTRYDIISLNLLSLQSVLMELVGFFFPCFKSVVSLCVSLYSSTLVC